MNTKTAPRRMTLLIVLVAITPALAASSANWSTPENLSGWQSFMEGYLMKMGADGTQAVFWPLFDIGNNTGTLWARVRSPGGDWSTAEDISGAVGPVTIWMFSYWSVGVAPDGTAWALWTVNDSVGKVMRVMESHRPPGGSWSTPQALSGWVTAVRTVELHVSPEGDLAAVWVECDTTSSDPAQGNCNVNVRRRPDGAASWEAAQKVDNSVVGVSEAHVRVGPGGLVVVIWNEANAIMANRWAVMARAYTPGPGWDTSVSEISGWIQPRLTDWLVQPVMDAGGTFVAAWNAMTSPGSAQDANYGNTRATTGTWGSPVQISNPHTQFLLDVPFLAVGEDGTVVGAWWSSDGSGSKGTALYANARDPGSTWGTEERISEWENGITLYGLEVWPDDGTAVALWGAVDASLPTTADQGLFWSARHGGTWGGGGKGQLGSWVNTVAGAALKLGEDGSGTAVWAVKDAGQPTGKQGAVLSTTWAPGGPWGSPETLGSGYGLTFVPSEGLALGVGGGSVGATWLAINNTTPMQVAIFYATTDTGSTSNTAPTASFSIQPSSGSTSTNFQFDASTSSDNEDPNSALLFRWDWEDDGTFDTPWDSSPNAQHSYSKVDTYTVRLEVQDSGGMPGTTTQNVTVTSSSSPWSNYIYLPMIVK